MASTSSIENLRSKFDSSNIVIVNQAFSKLHKTLLEKFPPGEKLITAEYASPELEFLWEKCMDNCAVVANGMCSIWTSLVLKGSADYCFVIKKLTNLALSSTSLSNSSNIVETLFNLLASEIALPLPYFNLRSQLHPIVRLLIVKPTFWPTVLEQLKLSLPPNNESMLQQNLLVFAPVLQFILWDPSRNAAFSTLRLKLLQHLVNTSSSSCCQDLKVFLYRCIFWLQVDCYEAVLESSWHLQEIAVLFQNPLYDSQEGLDTILLALVSISLEMARFNIDISGCIDNAKLLAKATEQTLATESTCATVVILSNLLTHSLPSHQSTIIHICSILLSRPGINSVVMGTLILPLILVLYSSSTLSTRATAFLKHDALKLLIFTKEKLNSGFAEKSPNVHAKTLITTGSVIHYEARNVCKQASFAFEHVRIAGEISKCYRAAYDWLQHTHNVLSSTKQIIKSQLYLISSVFMHNLQELETLEKCIEVFADTAKSCHDLAPSIFILMLHKLKIEQNPEMRLCILNSIPQLGIQKLNMNIILPTLRSFVKVPQLQPLAMRLLSSLWQYQERVYPYLFELLLNDKGESRISSDSGVDEISLAKASAILDICKLKPHLHGGEVLKILSNIILKNTSSSGSSPTALALESIVCLCKAEVIDLRTTWRSLSPIFNDDKRPLVIQKWCEFLSLAEMLKLETEDYEIFVNQAVTILWQNVQRETCVGASFVALAKFDITRHGVDNIPLKVRTHVDLAKKAVSISKKNKQSEEEEEATSFTLGPYLVALLMNVSLEDLNDYGQFLQAVVCQEVRTMPRSVFHFSEGRAALHGSKKRSSVLDQIPSYLLDKFESSPPPSTIGNLALSLLLAFHPKLNTSSDGSIIPQSAIHCGKSYCNMLETLLFKATLDTTEWRKCNMAAFAWGTFMERIFYSMINAHDANITLLRKSGHQDPNIAEDSRTLPSKAWLWARDKICDILKNSAKSNLSVHGNAIIALAGLAAAVNKYAVLNVEKVTSDVETPEYLLFKNWMSEVLTTMLNLLKPNSQIHQEIFSWCYLAPGMPINALQPFAAFSTVLLAPILVHWDIDIISEFLLNISLLLSSSPLSSPMLQFSLGLSLGQLISQLAMEHFTDVGEEAKAVLLTNANKLKQWCFNVEDSLLSSRNGGILGLSLVVSSFCQERCNEFQEFIVGVIEEFNQKTKSDFLPSSIKEVLFVARVLVTTSACGCGILSIEVVKSLCQEIEGTGLELSNDSGRSISYGLILQYLADSGDKDYVKLMEIQFQNWMKTIKTGGTSKVVAAINGLFSLFPTCLESKFMPGHTLKTLEVMKSNSNLTDFIKSLSKDLPLTSFDMSVQNCSFWIIGTTYCCLTNESSSINGEPMDYSYLTKQSTLKCVVDFILNNIKSGIMPQLQPHIVISLKCLEQDAGQRFPPINWFSLLKPVLFISKEIQVIAVGIAMAQSRYSQSAAALLTSLLISNSFTQLEECSQFKIFLHLHKFICILSTKTVHVFLTKHNATIFGSKSGSELPVAFLQGILNTLRGSNMPSGILEILYLAVVSVFHHVDPLVEDVWKFFVDASTELPDEVQDQMTMIDMKHLDNILKISRLRAAIVGCRRRPLQWLNDCIDALAALSMKKRSDSELDFVIAEYCSCFFKYNSSEMSSERSIEVDSINYVFELMGHIRSVMEGCSSLPIENEKHMQEVVSFLFIIFGLYITSLVDEEYGCYYYLWVVQKTALSNIVPQILPTALQHLAEKKSWSLHTKKFIYWFDFILRSESIEDSVKSSLKACLFHFRHCPELKTFDTWTHVMELGI